MEFFRFPRTPHLAWSAEGGPRGDKLLSAAEAQAFLNREILVEEKIDGANLGLSIGPEGRVRAQNRGGFVAEETRHPQFRTLFNWVEARRDALVEHLRPGLLLFGEWCYAVHTVRYSRLPDWFLAFDVYDQSLGEFWSQPRRDSLVAALGLELVPQLASGRFDLPKLESMLGASRLGEGPAEGLYLRADEGDRLVARAKLVRKEFLQTDSEHWSHRRLEVNSLTCEQSAAVADGPSDTHPRPRN